MKKKKKLWVLSRWDLHVGAGGDRGRGGGGSGARWSGKDVVSQWFGVCVCDDCMLKHWGTTKGREGRYAG